MTTLFGPDTFSGTNGNAVTGWTAGTYNTAGTSFTYQDGWGRINCGTVTGYAGKSGWRVTGLSAGDSRITCRFRFQGTDDGALRIILRGDTALDSQWGYVLVADRSGTDSIHLGKDVNWGGGTIAGPTSYDLTSGDIHHVDFLVLDTAPATLQVWVWADGSSKPSTPTFEVTDSSVTSPGAMAFQGVGGGAGGQLIEVDDAKGTDGTGDILLAGSAAAVGALVKVASKLFAGSATASGAQEHLKVILQLLTGSVTASGSALVARTRLLVGSMTAVGTLAKTANKMLTGAASGAGTMIKSAIRTFVGSATGVGTTVATFLGRVVGRPGRAEMTVRAAGWVRTTIRRR